ncbi:MAG TPA: ATP-binding protein, partial [Wenzhouxiangella sp.]
AQREAAWAEVARRLAHEVKNPLTPIQLAAERLHYKLSGELSGEQAALLERATSTIGSQVEALRRLVDAFGDYAKPKPPRMAPMRIKDAILEVVDLYASGDQAIAFDVDLDPSLSTQPIVADAGRLSQVLLNLVRNAQEAHPTGHPTIRIELSSSDRLDGSVCWQISDNGPGFSDEVLARAFEPYVTTKPGGTGLGLAIVKRIVEEHGGEIELANDQTGSLGGAVVRIWLPQPA